MKYDNSILFFATTIFLLNGCIAKSEKIELDKINYNYSYGFNNAKYNKLPTSTQFCVGDSCRATFIKSKESPHLVSIQVGAFRRYRGAEIYARRYGLLSNRYKTVIKNGFKSNRPIYRVQIEGFSNEDEANEFISKYSILSNSFLVRR